MDVATLVRQSRLAAGLTQAELAARMGTTQSAVARLEAPGSNPRVGTLDAALRATGHQLETTMRPVKQHVDEAQIAERLKLTPAQRLKLFEVSYANTRRFLEKAGRPRARPA
jgi:transcriptional regulator with XRE-family HTH domain